MSAGSESSTVQAYIVPGNNVNTCYHTDPDCHVFDQTWRSPVAVGEDRIRGRRECLYCSGEFERSFEHLRDIKPPCSCGKGYRGECGFCDAFDRIHDVPRDAEYCPVVVLE